MTKTVRSMRSSPLTALVTTYMVVAACIVSPTYSAINISITIDAFSDGSREFNADFVNSSVYNKQGISIQSGLWIDDATLKVSTATLGGNDYPVNITLDVGNDGSYEWMFKGPGYGPFGHQTIFSNNKDGMGVILPGNGGSNLSTYIRLPWGAHVTKAIMNISNAGGMAGGKVLLAVAVEQSYADDIQKKLSAFPDLTQIDIILTQYSTPTLETMKEYSSILVCSDYGIGDPYTLGNNLADYVDLGGGVVLATFCTQGYNMGPQGRFTSDNYYIIPESSDASYSGGSLGTVVYPDHPLMANVNSFSAPAYRSNTASVTPGSTVIAYWDDGYVLVGTKEIKGVARVDLGFYPPSSDVLSSWDSSTDGDYLLYNALAFAGKKSMNVSLDILNDSQIEWSNATFNNTVAIPDFTTLLNGYLASAAPSGTDAYGNSYVDIPLNLTASSGGSVRLQNLSIKYDLTTTVEPNPGGNLTMSLNDLMPIKVSPNNSTIPIVIISDSPGRLKVKSLNIRAHPPNHQPTLASFEPVGPQVMDENASLDFSVSAVDIYGNPLTYRWFHNGVPVEGVTDSAFTLETDYNDAGNHTVTITIMNGLDTLGHTWDVAVLDANRAPVITGSTPPDNPTTPENASIAFTVNATDPDGDTLLYSWALDGKTVPRANLSTYSYLGDFYSSGEHMVTATVTDLKNASISKLWKLTVENTNVAPYIVEYQPRNNPKMRELESVRFSVSGADIDNQSVSATWYLDGVQMYVGTSYTYKTDYTSAGIHEVKVVVSDGFLDVFRTWKVTVENVNRLPSPAIDSPKDVLDYMSGDVVKFSAKSSSDIDNDPLNFTWKEDTVVLSTQMEFERTFAPGLHTITLYVLDPYGGLNSTTVRFRVRNVELAGIIGLDRLDIKPGDKVSIIATLSNIGDANSTSFNVEVLVDGTSLGSKSIAQLNAGSAQRETFAWKAGKAGNHTVVLKVGEKSWQKTIYVESRAVETTDTAAGTNEAIGMMLILVVMVVLLAFGIMMMRRK